MGEKARGERESDRRSRLRGEGETDKRQWAKERAAREREYACEESATSAPGIGTAGAETRPETPVSRDRMGRPREGSAEERVSGRSGDQTPVGGSQDRAARAKGKAKERISQ